MKREELKSWIEDSNYIERLKEYIALKSRTMYKDEVEKAAEYLKQLVLKMGMTSAKIIETIGNPVVFAERIIDQELPTILFYGHYDVQHEGDKNLWNTDPFKAEIIDKKLFGRGTADNKGQHFAHLLAISYLRDNHLDILNRLNLKFIFDGDEEKGSYSLPDFFKNNRELLQSDILIVSDGPSLSYETGSIVGSTRGILAFQITMQHNPEDLHSGNFGGISRSAGNDLIKLIASMVDENGHCLILDFYQEVVKPTEFENEQLVMLKDLYRDTIRKRNIIPQEPLETRAKRNQMLPTFNVNGLQTGAVGKHRRTIIPARATVSIDIRLVPSMTAKKTRKRVEKHVFDWLKKQNIPKSSVSIEFESPMESCMTDFTNEYFEALKEAMKFGFNKEPIIVPRLGGSLPLYLFPEVLGLPFFLIPYALPDENNHAPNENLDLKFFESGVMTTIKFLHNVATKIEY